MLEKTTDCMKEFACNVSYYLDELWTVKCAIWRV